METLTKQVLEHAAGMPEGTPLVAKELLHLGSRAAVDQVLSRLVRRGSLLRAGRGIYVLPVESRFGSRAPSAIKMVEGLANQRGETIVSHGAAAANALGLTTQVPMRASRSAKVCKKEAFPFLVSPTQRTRQSEPIIRGPIPLRGARSR